MNEIEEKQYLAFRKNKGRRAVIRNPYYTTLEKGTEVYIYSVDENLTCRVLEFLDGSPIQSKMHSVKFDELNFIDKEYSGTGLIKKGVRQERKDKYKGNYVIELLNDGKSIQLSQALLSLLQTNVNEYIGFAYDPEIKSFYIYSTNTENDGYLINKTNGRIISIADHRELLKTMNSSYIIVDSTPILDLEKFPDLIFYSLFPDKSHLTVGTKQNNVNKSSSEIYKQRVMQYFEEPIFTTTFIGTDIIK